MPRRCAFMMGKKLNFIWPAIWAGHSDLCRSSTLSWKRKLIYCSVPCSEIGGPFHLDPEKEWPVGRLCQLSGCVLPIQDSLGVTLLAEESWAAPYLGPRLCDKWAVPSGLKCPGDDSIALALLGDMYLGEMYVVVMYFKSQSFPSGKIGVPYGWLALHIRWFCCHCYVFRWQGTWRVTLWPFPWPLVGLRWGMAPLRPQRGNPKGDSLCGRYFSRALLRDWRLPASSIQDRDSARGRGLLAR